MDFSRYNNFSTSSYHNNPSNIQFYSVSSRQEAKGIQIPYGIKSIIINNIDREIYIKEMNNDGLMDFIVYKDERLTNFKSEEKNKEIDSKLKLVDEKVETLSNKLVNLENSINKISSSIFTENNKIVGNRNEYDKQVSGYGSQETVGKTSYNASIQPNDGWKNNRTEETNHY